MSDRSGENLEVGNRLESEEQPSCQINTQEWSGNREQTARQTANYLSVILAEIWIESTIVIVCFSLGIQKIQSESISQDNWMVK